MTFFFLLQFVAYLVSLLVLGRWVNFLLEKHLGFEAGYLPAWSWGWSVYFALYLAGRWMGLPVAWLLGCYTGLALGVASWGLVAAARRLRRGESLALGRAGDRGTLLLVGLVVLGAMAAGPYLEFPSDAVEYFYRIQAWEKARWMSYSGLGYYNNFSSFTNYWLLRPAAVTWGDRASVAALSAVWQGLLFWQFVRLGCWLTGCRAWGWLAGLLSLGYFGYDAISFYRYTTFASAMLGQIVYLEALLVIFAVFLTERWRYALLLLPLLLLGANSHLQAALFQFNALAGCAVLSLICRYGTLSQRFRRSLLLLVGGGLGVSLALLLRPWHAENVGAGYRHLHLFNLAPDWGEVLLLSRYGPLSKVLGLVGWLGLVVAIAVLLYRRPERKLDLTAMVAVWPVLAVLNPLLVQGLMRVMAVELLHRLLYGSVVWVLLVGVLQAGARSRLGWKLGRGLVFAGMGVVAAVLSWLPGNPIYGKMAHVWHRVDPQLDGSDLQPVLRYLRANAPQVCTDPVASLAPHLKPIRSYVLSDPYVNTYLLNTGYFHAATNRGDRWAPESPNLGLSVGLEQQPDLTYAEFQATLREFGVCYVVLYRPQKRVTSWLGRTSGHWFPEYAQTQRFYAPKLLRWVRYSGDFEMVFEAGGAEVFRVKQKPQSGD